MSWDHPKNVFANASGSNHIFVRSKGDLPPAVGGVITLITGRTYELMKVIDLTGDRIFAQPNVMIKGQTSENSGLISTGLGEVALITSNNTLVLRDMTITAPIGARLTNANVDSLDWVAVNFVDCTTNAAIITDYNNVLLSDLIIVNSGPFVMVGDFATFAIFNCLISAAAGKVAIEIHPDATFSRRFRIIYSAIIAGDPTSTALKLLPANLLTNETFILDTVNFSGGGTFLDGISSNDNESLITNCVGVANTAEISQYYMTGNVTATVLTDQGVYYKIAGTTISLRDLKFVNTVTQRAKYVGSRQALFKAIATLTVSGQANNDHGFAWTKNGVLIPGPPSVVTMPAGGRLDNVTLNTIADLVEGDHLELFMANLDSSGKTAVVSELNAIVSPE